MLKDIDPEVTKFVTSLDTLRQQAGLNLDERVGIVRANFELHNFNLYHLREIYRRHKVALKKIKLSKIISSSKLQE